MTETKSELLAKSNTVENIEKTEVSYTAHRNAI